jgi:hypothetical protein
MNLNFNVEPWVEQLIADETHEELAVSAGLGSGKTHGACQWAIHRCMLNSRSPKMAFTEPLFRLLRTAAIPTFRKVLHALEWSEGSDYEVNQGAPVPSIKLKRTNQEILMFSASTPQSIVADEYHSFVMDEAGESQPLAFQNLQARTRCSQAVIRQGLHVGAPQGITHFAKLFGLPEEGGADIGWDKIAARDFVNQRLSRRRIQLRTFDNPHVNGGDVLTYCKRLMRQYGHNQALVNSYIYGVFCALFEGGAYDFLPSRHVAPEEFDPDPYRTLYLSFDFNAYPMAWVAGQIIPHEGEMVYLIAKEASKSLQGLDEALFDFVKKFPRKEWRKSEIKVYGDRSGHASHHRVKLSDYDFIRKELSTVYDHVSIQATKLVAPESESVDVCNRLFKLGRLMCNPSCTQLQRSWQSMRWKDGERKLHKPSGETISHVSDATKYLIYQLEVLDALQTRKKTYGVNV